MYSIVFAFRSGQEKLARLKIKLDVEEKIYMLLTQFALKKNLQTFILILNIL